MSKSKLLVIAVIAAAITAFFVFDLKQYVTLDYFQAQREAINTAVATDPLRAGLLFFAIYTVATGLSLPGAAVLTLLGGALFGLGWGLVLVSFASSIGGGYPPGFSVGLPPPGVGRRPPAGVGHWRRR